MAYGGYASHIRAHEYFVFSISHNLESSFVAPMLCAGITTYNPLFRAKLGPGKTVGVVRMYAQTPVPLPFGFPSTRDIQEFGLPIYYLHTAAD